MKETFDENGLQTVLTGLYGLSDAALNEQVQQVQANLPAWLALYFVFSPAQQQFLDQLTSNMLAFLSLQTAAALGNRLPITLQKEGEPDEEDDPDGDGQGKYFKIETAIEASQNNEGVFVITGGLALQSVYS